MAEYNKRAVGSMYEDMAVITDCLNSQNGIISIMINIKKAMACLSEQL